MNDALLKKLAKPLIVAATLIWGSTFFLLKDTLDDVDPLFLLAFRFTFAAVLLALVFRKRWKGVDAAYWRQGGLMGLFLFAAYTVQTYGLMGTTPGKNAFFTSVYCVIVPFLYWLTDRRKPTVFHVAAAFLCVAGVGLVSWDGGFVLSWGDGLTLISGLLYAFHIVAATRFSLKRDVFILTVIQFGTAAVCCWIGTLFFTHGVPVDGLPARAWWVLVYLAVAATSMALLFQNIGQKYTEPAAAALLLALEAPFGVAFSVIFTDEAPTPLMYLGFAVIFLAVVCSETEFKFLRPKAKA